MTSRFVSNSDVRGEWCQGLRFHVTRQELTSVRTLVQELRLFIYQVLTGDLVYRKKVDMHRVPTYVFIYILYTCFIVYI